MPNPSFQTPAVRERSSKWGNAGADHFRAVQGVRPFYYWLIAGSDDLVRLSVP